MIFLIVINLIILIVTFILSNRDIISPSVMFCLGYFISSICCAINYKTWGVGLHINTIIVLVMGMIIFVIIDFICRTVFNKRCNGVCNTEKSRNIELLSISRSKQYFFIIYAILISIIYYKAVQKMVMGAGINNLTSITRYVRSILVGNITSTYKISSIITQSYKPVVAISYIFLFVFTNNVIALDNIAETFKKYSIYLVVPIIACIGNMLFQGGRLTIIRFALASLVFGFTLKSFQRGHMYGLRFKAFLKLVICVALAGFLFYMSTNILGRGKEYKLVAYVTNYFGGGIALFDQYMQEHHNIPTIFGEETFHDLIDLIRKLGLISYDGIYRLEFRKLGIGANNVYTGYRRLINDFGILGMVILHVFMCFTFSYLYNIIRITIYGVKKVSTGLIMLYAYLFFCIAVHPFDNYFYQLLSLNNIMTLILIWILWRFCFNVNLYNRKVIIKRS